MWTGEDRVLVGDFRSGQALTDDQFRLLEPFIPPAKPGGRPRTAGVRRLLDGLFYVVRTGSQWRHLPPPPAFPPWPTASRSLPALRAAGGPRRPAHRAAGGRRRPPPPPPAPPPCPTVSGSCRAFRAAGGWESLRPDLVVMLREGG